MERPQVKNEQKQRTVTGEIVYLDELRRNNERPKPYNELGGMAMQMYEAEADAYSDGKRPAIMDEYEQYDYRPSETVASCKALADQLLALKDPNDSFNFERIAVEETPQDVLAKLTAISAGGVLAADDEQLAIASNGEYYPVLDIQKKNATLTGVGLVVRGWDDVKQVFTTNEGEAYKYPDDVLRYPADEVDSTRTLELAFGYTTDDNIRFTESVTMRISAGGSATFYSQVWVSRYAETGYEGHGGKTMQPTSDEEVAAFGDLIAEIVGDTPRTERMKEDQEFQGFIEALATPSARKAVQDLVALTWQTQASYLLTMRLEAEGKTIAELLCDVNTADEGVAGVEAIMAAWRERRGR